jgi:hypothetical protein
MIDLDLVQGRSPKQSSRGVIAGFSDHAIERSADRGADERRRRIAGDVRMAVTRVPGKVTFARLRRYYGPWGCAQATVTWGLGVPRLRTGQEGLCLIVRWRR